MGTNMNFLKVTKLYELLKIAMLDLRWCERRGYTIDMSKWIGRNAITREVCTVCMAGSCLVRQNLSMTDAKVDRYCQVINYLRCGYLDYAYNSFYQPGRHVYMRHFEVCQYSLDKKQFWLDIGKLYDYLVTEDI